MKFVTFQIIGRGDILMSNTIEVADKEQHTFKFLASFSMVPKATLIVYYITEKGEIVSDKSELKFASEFQNPVSFFFFFKFKFNNNFDLLIYNLGQTRIINNSS